LGAAETAVLGVIAVGDDLDVLNGVFRRRNDGGSAPDSAGGADTVDTDAVVLVLLARRQRLRTIFRLKDSAASAVSARALRARQVGSASASSQPAIAKDARRQLNQGEDISSERRQMLNRIAVDRPADGGGLGLDGRYIFRRHVDRLA